MTTGFVMEADYDGSPAYVLFTDRLWTVDRLSGYVDGRDIHLVDKVAERLVDSPREVFDAGIVRKWVADPSGSRLAAISSQAAAVTFHIARSLLGSEHANVLCGCEIDPWLSACSYETLSEFARVHHGFESLSGLKDTILLIEPDGMRRYEQGRHEPLEGWFAFGSGAPRVEHEMEAYPDDPLDVLVGGDVFDVRAFGSPIALRAIAKDPYSSGLEATVVSRAGIATDLVEEADLDLDVLTLIRASKRTANARFIDRLVDAYLERTSG